MIPVLPKTHKSLCAHFCPRGFGTVLIQDAEHNMAALCRIMVLILMLYIFGKEKKNSCAIFSIAVPSCCMI